MAALQHQDQGHRLQVQRLQVQRPQVQPPQHPRLQDLFPRLRLVRQWTRLASKMQPTSSKVPSRKNSSVLFGILAAKMSSSDAKILPAHRIWETGASFG